MGLIGLNPTEGLLFSALNLIEVYRSPCKQTLFYLFLLYLFFARKKGACTVKNALLAPQVVYVTLITTVYRKGSKYIY